MVNAVVKNKDYLYLFLMVIAALLIRFVLLYVRWINPDEGAHLMDARLMLEGLMPVVDYDSRQPVYLLLMATAMKYLGVSLFSGRLIPLLSSVGSGIMIFFLGRKLFRDKVGLIASAVYLFLPLVLLWSVNIKEEPLAIFMGITSMFFITKAIDDPLRRSGWIILSGIFAGIAYYSRQSSIYLPATVFFYAFLRRDIQIRQTAIFLFMYFLGYLSICVFISGFFLGKLGFQGILFSQLNPFYIVFYNIFHLLGMLPKEYQVVQGSGLRVLDQDIGITLIQWKNTIFFSYFILTGALAIALRAILGSHRDNPVRTYLHDYKYSYILMSLWLLFIIIPYALQSAVRGFYTQYFVEFLPPLILIASVYFEIIYTKINVRFVYFIGGSFAGLYTVFFIQKILWQFYPGMGVYMLTGSIIGTMGLYFFSKKWDFKLIFMMNLVSAIIICLLYYSLKRLNIDEFFATLITMMALYAVIKFMGGKIKSPGDHVRMDVFARLYIIIIALIISGAYSGRFLGPKYECPWSVQTLKQVNGVLRVNSDPGDEVLSGGTIWAIDNDLRPFLNVPHPTEFLKQVFNDFDERYYANRPEFIILDGYTQKKFERFWTIISRDLSENYRLLATVKGSLYPVKVYRVNDHIGEELSVDDENNLTERN